MSILSLLLLNSLLFSQKMLLFLSKSTHLYFDYCTKMSFFFVGFLCAASERTLMKKFIIYLLKPFSFLGHVHDLLFFQSDRSGFGKSQL